MINHEDVATLFLRETYPHYKCDDYDIVWLRHDLIDIIWKRGGHKKTRHHVEELISFISGDEKTFCQEVDKFVSLLHPVDYLEAANHGFLSISPKTSCWQITTNRLGGITKNVFLNKFNEDERNAIRQTWSENIQKDIFAVKADSLLIEIVSSHDSIPASHCLFSSEIVHEILKDAYDISDKTQVLIGSKPKDSLLIGHEDAVERLFDTPGSIYCRKNYMNINDELWSNHNGQ